MANKRSIGQAWRAFADEPGFKTAEAISATQIKLEKSRFGRQLSSILGFVGAYTMFAAEAIYIFGIRGKNPIDMNERKREYTTQ